MTLGALKDRVETLWLLMTRTKVRRAPEGLPDGFSARGLHLPGKRCRPAEDENAPCEISSIAEVWMGDSEDPMGFEKLIRKRWGVARNRED